MEDLHDNDPRSVGGFKLLGRLGAGGFGVVYAAEDADGSPFALKVLRPELADDSGLRERLGREGDLLRRVSGTRTVKIFDVVTEGPHAYLVMERLEGESLDKIVNENGPLQGPMLWFAAEALFEALDDIHKAGIVHRDLKPSNIILGPDGLKVLDFGVSVVADQTALTRTGAFVGTAAWISPEQINGDQVTPASDVFNAGLVLAYAATGRHPFGEGRADAVMYRIAHQQPNLTGVAEPLLGAVNECLERHPLRRPTVDGVRKFLSSDGAVSLANLASTAEDGSNLPDIDAAIVSGSTTDLSGTNASGVVSVGRTRVIASGQPDSRHTQMREDPTRPERSAVRRPAVLIGGSMACLAAALLSVAVLGRDNPNPQGATRSSEPTEPGAGVSATAIGVEMTQSETSPTTSIAILSTTTQSGVPRSAQPDDATGGAPILSDVVVSAAPSPAVLTFWPFTVTWTITNTAKVNYTRAEVFSPAGSLLNPGCYEPVSRVASTTTTTTYRQECQIDPGEGGGRFSATVSAFDSTYSSLLETNRTEFTVLAEESDSTDPTIASATVSPSTVSAGSEITVTFRARDNLRIAYVWVQVKWASTFLDECDGSANLVSGNVLDGNYSFSCTIPSGAPSGSDFVAVIDVQDWSSGRTFAEVRFTVVSTNSDVDAPILVSSSVSPSTVARGSTFTIAYSVTDASPYAVSWSIYELALNDYSCRIEDGSLPDRRYTCTAPATSSPGVYTIRFLMTDQWGNQAQVSGGTLTVT